MAKRVTTTVEEDDAQELKRAAEEMAALNAESDGDLFRVTDEIRAFTGVFMQVRCVEPADKEGFVGKIPISEFSHELLQRRYGSGTYICRMQGPKGFLPGGGTVKIAALPAAEAAGGRGEFMTFIEYMDKRDREAQGRRDRLLELSIPALATIVSGLFSRQGGTDVAALVAALKPAPGPSLTDLTTSLQQMQLLSAPRGADPLDAALKMVERLKDLATDGGESSANRGSSWVDVIRDVIKEAGPLMGSVAQGIAAQRAAASGQPPQVRQVQPAIAATAASASTAQPSALSADAATGNQSQDEKMLALFKPLILEKLALVAKWAEEDREPMTYVEVFMDDLPPNIGQFLPQEKALEYVMHADWYKVVCEWEPKLKTHEKWCQEFRDYLLRWLSTEAPENPAAAPAGGAEGESGT